MNMITDKIECEAAFAYMNACKEGVNVRGLRAALNAAIPACVEWFNSLTPEQQAEHRKTQAESWVHGKPEKPE